MIGQAAVSLLMLGFAGLGFIGRRATPFGVVMFACVLVFLGYTLAGSLRPVSMRIDHTRGVVSFRRRLLSRRAEISLARIKGAEFETATRVAARQKGGGVYGMPTTVGRICLLLEDERLPIDDRMHTDLEAPRKALAQIIEALEAARPEDDTGT
jgi:hypothetical protein